MPPSQPWQPAGSPEEPRHPASCHGASENWNTPFIIAIIIITSIIIITIIIIGTLEKAQSEADSVHLTWMLWIEVFRLTCGRASLSCVSRYSLLSPGRGLRLAWLEPAMTGGAGSHTCTASQDCEDPSKDCAMLVCRAFLGFWRLWFCTDTRTPIPR